MMTRRKFAITMTLFVASALWLHAIDEDALAAATEKAAEAAHFL